MNTNHKYYNKLIKHLQEAQSIATALDVEMMDGGFLDSILSSIVVDLQLMKEKEATRKDSASVS